MPASIDEKKKLSQGKGTLFLLPPQPALRGTGPVSAAFWTNILSPTELNIIKRGRLVSFPQLFKQSAIMAGHHAMVDPLLAES